MGRAETLAPSTPSPPGGRHAGWAGLGQRPPQQQQQQQQPQLLAARGVKREPEPEQPMPGGDGAEGGHSKRLRTEAEAEGGGMQVKRGGGGTPRGGPFVRFWGAWLAGGSFLGDPSTPRGCPPHGIAASSNIAGVGVSPPARSQKDPQEHPHLVKLGIRVSTRRSCTHLLQLVLHPHRPAPPLEIPTKTSLKIIIIIF